MSGSKNFRVAGRSTFQVGAAYCFTYPTQRRVAVIHSRPDGLLYGKDLDSYRSCTLQAELITDPQELSIELCRLALVDPIDDSVPPRFFGPMFTNSATDRARIRELIRRFNRRVERGQFGRTMNCVALPVGESVRI